MKRLAVLIMLLMAVMPGIVVADQSTGLKVGGRSWSPYECFWYLGPPPGIQISEEMVKELLETIPFPQERRRITERWLQTFEQSWTKSWKFQEDWLELQKNHLRFQREIEQLQLEKLKLHAEIEKLRSENLRLEKENLELRLKLGSQVGA